MTAIVHQTLALLPPWLSLSLISLLSLFIILRLKNKGLNLPPSPPKLPIIGNLHLLAGNNPHQALYKLSQKYGPTMQLQLGNIQTLVVSNAEMAKEVLRTHDADFCSRPDSPGAKRLSYGYLDVALSPHNNYRTEMRKLLSFELLKMKREESLWTARKDEMSNLIKNVTKLARTPVNLDGHIFTLTDGIIGQVALGKCYGATQFEGHKFKEVVDECMSMLTSFTAEDFFPNTWAGRFIDIVSGQKTRLEKVFGQFDRYFTMMIEDHLDQKKPRSDAEDFVDVLLRLHKYGYGESKFTMEHIKSILMNTFLGAVDTTAVSVLWAMAELLLCPEALKRGTEEVRSVAGKKSMVEEGDLKHLKYINCIVKEIFRMHPAAPLLVPHYAINSAKIGKEGYDVPAGTRIIVNAWAIGRDPAYWTDPHKFFPERFEESDVEFKGGHFQFIPFGSGRRICPGIAMGFTTFTYILANLLHCFDWELPEGVRFEDVCMKEIGGLTMHKKTPLIVVPTRIN